jgi:orotidine-5'-phosphate decarboxylase
MSPADAKKWKENVDHDGSNIKAAASDYSKIKPGVDVTIADSRGRKQTGTAQKKTPAGWTVDVDGRDVIATPDNVVAVKVASDSWKV